MNELSKTLSLVALGSLLLHTVACDPKTDQKAAEADVKKLMLEKNQLTLVTVTCPPNQSGKAGTTFKCEGTDELGTTATFTVVVGENLFQVSPEEGLKLKDMKALGDAVEASLTPKYGKVDVTCPGKVVMIKKGTKFGCDIKPPTGAAGKITFTVGDNNSLTQTVEGLGEQPAAHEPAAHEAHEPPP